MDDISDWEKIRTAFIGENGIDKASLIRQLQTYALYDNKKAKIAKKMIDHYQSSTLLTENKNEENGSVLDFDNDDMKVNENELNMNNNNTFIEVYRQYYSKKTEVEFYDTIGNIRFARYLFECMLKCHVIVIVYRLSLNDKNINDEFESIRFVKDIDNKIIESLSNDYDYDTVKSKFNCLLIGIGHNSNNGNDSQNIQEDLV